MKKIIILWCEEGDSLEPELCKWVRDDNPENMLTAHTKVKELVTKGLEPVIYIGNECSISTTVEIERPVEEGK